MVTIKDVANKAGVSAGTVSRALSGRVNVKKETKEKVLQAVKELNYQPNLLAQGLKEGRSKTIGLVLPNVRDLVFPAAIRGITDVAREAGYTVILCNTDGDMEAEHFYIDNLRKRFVDGFIFSTATPQSKHILELQRLGIPVVLLIRHVHDFPLDSVIVDNYGGGYDATNFLISQGFRRIMLVNGDMSLELYQERFQGYRAALSAAGLPLDESIIFHNIEGWQDGYRLMREFLQHQAPPEAVFATSDPKALGVAKACREFGLRVGEDISIMGFDNLELSELLEPPLTTMAQPFYDLGVRAATRLLKLIKSKKRLKPVTERLKATLLVRGSVRLLSSHFESLERGRE